MREEQNYLVVKHNDLIREVQARLSLTVNEQKVALYLVSLINPDDKDFDIVFVSISALCELFGLEKVKGNYERLKKAIKTLRDKSCWIQGKLFSWIDAPEVIPNSGMVRVKLSESLKPYLLQLKENFTKYKLYNVLVLKSKYSIRIYELLKSYFWEDTYSVTIQEFKKSICCDTFNEFKDFNKWVLAPAIKEINELTDIYVEVTKLKTGKCITDLKFDIKEPSKVMPFDSILYKINEVHMRLKKASSTSKRKRKF